jgi:hypothetical protein
MFGFPSGRHVMKIAPFTMRLVSATKQLMKGIQSNDPMEMARGIEDVGFWTARTTAELISGQEEGEENLDIYKKAMHALFEAQRVSVRARKQLGQQSNYGMVNSSPSTTGALWSVACFLSGPLLIYAASQLESKWLSHAVALVGLGIVGSQVHEKWHSSEEMKDKVLSTGTAMIPYSTLNDVTPES